MTLFEHFIVGTGMLLVGLLGYLIAWLHDQNGNGDDDGTAY